MQKNFVTFNDQDQPGSKFSVEQELFHSVNPIFDGIKIIDLKTELITASTSSF